MPTRPSGWMAKNTTAKEGWEKCEKETCEWKESVRGNTCLRHSEQEVCFSSPEVRATRCGYWSGDLYVLPSPLKTCLGIWVDGCVCGSLAVRHGLGAGRTLTASRLPAWQQNRWMPLIITVCNRPNSITGRRRHHRSHSLVLLGTGVPGNQLISGKRLFHQSLLLSHNMNFVDLHLHWRPISCVLTKKNKEKTTELLIKNLIWLELFLCCKLEYCYSGVIFP